MWNGLLLPNGEYPDISGNRGRRQDYDLRCSNQETYTMFAWRLMDMAMSVFKWDNLPEGVDERQLEFWLLRDGFCGFFYDEMLKSDEKKRAPDGFAVLPMMISGTWDIYQYPTDRTAYATNGLNYKCDESNSVLIFNNFLRVPMMLTIENYARRLAQVQRTIDINVEAQKTPKVIRCSDKRRLTMLNFAKEVDEGKPWIFGDKNLDMESIEVFDTSTPIVVDELQILKHQLWNEALTYLGIENVNTDKKERMVSDEIYNNMGDVEGQRFTRLNARRQAVDEINKMFGLEIEVSFRTGMYIKAYGFAARNLPTMGFSDGGEMDYQDMLDMANIGGIGGASNE